MCVEVLEAVDATLAKEDKKSQVSIEVRPPRGTPDHAATRVLTLLFT